MASRAKENGVDLLFVTLFLVVFSFPEEKPKPDPVLKPPSPVLRPEPTGEKKDQAGQTSEATPADTPPELPVAPSPAPAAPVAAAPAAVSSKSALAADSEEKCELASPKEEAAPAPGAAPCADTPAPSPAAEADAEGCQEPSSVAPADTPLTASTNLINELNGVSEKVTVGAESAVDVAQAAVAPLTVESEAPEAAPVEGDSVSPPAAPSPPPTPPATPPPPSPPLSVAAVTTTAPSPPPPPSPSALPGVQGDLEGEESTRTALNEEGKDAEKKEETEADGQLEESAEAPGLNLSKSPVPGERPAPQLCAVKPEGEGKGVFGVVIPLGFSVSICHKNFAT